MNSVYCVQLGGFLPLFLECGGGGKELSVEFGICQ